jgi:hypothetical protein
MGLPGWYSLIKGHIPLGKLDTRFQTMTLGSSFVPNLKGRLRRELTEIK